MKRKLSFIVSLTLGLLMASCQNGLEEIINESAVQDELATTRAEDEEPVDDLQAAELQAAELRGRSVGLEILGSRIISGTDEETFNVSVDTSLHINLNSYVKEWAYNSGILHKISGGGNSTTITLNLLSSSNTSDTYLTIRLKNPSTGAVEYATTINIGCNGPLAGTSNIRVVRSSDGAEVFPSSIGLRPNTFYYAYFSNSMAYNMSLTWIFNHATIYNSYGYLVYFKTDSAGYSFLTVKGRMPNSSTDKTMINSITLYGGSDSSYTEGEDLDSEEEIGAED